MEDPTIKHPAYLRFAPSWELLRDAVLGEDDVKAKGVRYLPMKTGTAAIPDESVKARVYDLYRTRAEFPEVTAPTIRGAVGVMLGKPAKIELPEAVACRKSSYHGDRSSHRTSCSRAGALPCSRTQGSCP